MPRKSSIQAVTFDVGGTLITPTPSVGEIYARIAAGHGFARIAPDLLETRFAEAWRKVRPFQHRREDWERLVDAVFEGLVPHPPSETFFDALYREFSFPRAWRLFDDVLPTLESLAAQGVDLGIVSNWDERLRPLLEELRLDRYFDSIVISCETGFIKPSQVIFEESLRQLGHPTSAVLHVGDALREDFTGAIGAGLQALHLRRDAPSRDLQIRSLSEIPAWIQSDMRPS